MNIAFIGLGSMGGPMAANLVRSGYVVTGYDELSQALSGLKANGGSSASSAAAAASKADAVILMVVNAAQAEHVLFDEGVLDALPPSAVVILMATCPPGSVKAIANRVKATGRSFVDAQSQEASRVLALQLSLLWRRPTALRSIRSVPCWERWAIRSFT